MLKTVDLIKNVEEDLIPMLKEVNIVDFTKCVSIFSGLDLSEISDKQIREYLITWAKNKKRIYKMLGNSLYKDINFKYEKVRDENKKEFKELEKQYPMFAPWIDAFSEFPTNKIEAYSYRFDSKIFRKFMPELNVDGMSITHFAKKYLSLPDDIVTSIGRIYENNEIDATYTISIDPVEIMLASENPYGWSSCYRLETENSSSHADGCMAAVLDKNSTITCIWTSRGKYSLYNKYELKDIRYKRMRQFVNISENLANLCFNDIYPGKDYPDKFYKQLRDLYETVVADYHKVKNLWKRADTECYREDEGYGYNEFCNTVFHLDGFNEEDIPVYTEPIECACGCGVTLSGAYNDDEHEYRGEGFNHEGFEDRYWCEYAEDYCDNCGEDCEGCSAWENAHPVCAYDETEECEYPERVEVSGGVAEACDHCCENCSLYARIHADESEDREEEEEQQTEEHTSHWITQDNPNYESPEVHWGNWVRAMPITGSTVVHSYTGEFRMGTTV